MTRVTSEAAVIDHIERRMPFRSSTHLRLSGRWRANHDQKMYGVFYGAHIAMLCEPDTGRWYYAPAWGPLIVDAAITLDATSVDWNTVKYIWTHGFAAAAARRIR